MNEFVGNASKRLLVHVRGVWVAKPSAVPSTTSGHYD